MNDTIDTRKLAATESTTSFDFKTFIVRVKRSLQKKYANLTCESMNDLIYKNLRDFRLNGQQFDYEKKPKDFGGNEFVVKCPKCGKNCTNLYLPNLPDRESLYLCLNCHRLKSYGKIIAGSKLYNKVIKPLRKLEKLNKILLEKNLTPEQAQPYLDEYRIIEKALAESPEYRLYKFRKEHGVQQ